MKKILILLSALSIVSFADFTEINGVVTDSETNLNWQNDYTTNSGNVKSATWTNALAYCSELNLDGKGWRLANIKELTTIMDDGSTNSAKSYSILSLIEPSDYWTSTTYNSDSTFAWILDFDTGNHDKRAKSVSKNVICVRGGR